MIIEDKKSIGLRLAELLLYLVEEEQRRKDSHFGNPELMEHIWTVREIIQKLKL